MTAWTLAGGVLCLCALYVFFVHQTVLNVSKRAEIERSVSTLRSSTTSLQAHHIAISSKITSELAYSLGYKEVSPTFIPRQSVSTLAGSGSLQ